MEVSGVCSSWGVGRECHGCPECCQEFCCEEKLLGSPGDAVQWGKPLIPSFFGKDSFAALSMMETPFRKSSSSLSGCKQESRELGGLIPLQMNHLSMFPNLPGCKNLWQLPAAPKWIKSSGTGGSRERLTWGGFPQPCGSWGCFFFFFSGGCSWAGWCDPCCGIS